MVPSLAPPSIKKMKREGIIFIALTFIIALTSCGIGKWFEVVFACFGIYISLIAALSVLEKLLKPKKSKKIVNKIIDVISIRKPVTYENISDSNYRVENKAIKAMDHDYLTITQNHRLFAQKTNIIDKNFKGPMPQHLSFLTSKKMCYELRRKYGPNITTLLPQPTLSKVDILRELEEDEVLDFHNFCKEHSLT